MSALGTFVLIVFVLGLTCAIIGLLLSLGVIA